MPVRLKVGAVITCVLAVLFYLFFQISKQNPALSQVNVFAEDPYDAVGSFGIQLALCTALLALVRAFRPYPYQSSKALESQKLLLLRAEYVTCLAVAVTLAADIVALLRYPTLWVGFSAGQLLAGLTGGMVLLTALVAWLIRRSKSSQLRPAGRYMWIRAMVIFVVDVLILALYPESWRQSAGGAFFTVVVGIAILFVTVRTVTIALSPHMETPFEDVLDDLAAISRWLKAHLGVFSVIFQFPQRMLSLPFVRATLSWLNPRRHAWNMVLLIGICIGAMLALAEAMSEGGPRIDRFALVVAIFISLECVGVLTGYALLARPLGLFRKNSAAIIDVL